MTRHVVWQSILALLGIVLVFLVLFQLAPEREIAPAPTEEVPVGGGTYIEGVLGYWEGINPILAPIVVQAHPLDQDLSSLVFDGLTTLDATGQVSPSLALDWDVSEDGTIYEFRLRQDVVWHDGAPFTAADVAFTVQAMQDPNYQGATALRELWRTVTVEQVDEYTVRFVLGEPFPSFMYYTTIGLLPAHLLSNVPASDLPRHEFSIQKPIGTGMFQVESVSPDRVVLAANPNYWGPKPYLDHVEFWFFSNWEGLLADYEQGAIHGFHPPRPQVLETLATLSNLQLYSAQSSGYGIVFLNLGRETLPFFQVREVRQALLYAMSRQTLVDQVLDGQGLIADSPIPPVSWAFDPGVRQYRHDPERAIGLLDASGWLDSDADRIRDQEGAPLAFTLLVSDDPVMVEMAEKIVEQWRAVGIDATVQPESATRLPTAIQERAFDAVLIEVGLTADPDPYPLWHSTQGEAPGQNFSGWANDEADLVMEEGRFTTDLDERAALYHTFQQIFTEEVPSLLIYYPIYVYAADARVHGVQLSPLLHTSDRFRNIQQWYLESKPLVVNGNELDKTGK